MPRPPSRKNKPGEHTYLLTRIPLKVWTQAAHKTAQDHAAVCGSDISHERCPTHSMKALIVRLLQHYGSGTLKSAADRI